ncbi:MAG: PQQ-dependent sugar dehydrogenase [Gemmatirosa sp.]|nr:PQQ-dependent sugar dehydrogenase [Gemmatirosa sp.]
MSPLHRRIRSLRLVVPATAGAAAVVALAAAGAPAARAAKPDCAPDNGGITLPAGFCATIFVDTVGGPRHIAVAANGDVYVNRQPRRAGTSAVLALRDTNGDGRADIVQSFGTGGATGIAVVPGWVYVDEKDRIVRYPLAGGALVPTGASQTIVSGLPTGGHDARNIVLDGKGNLFVNVGSNTNSCQQTDRTARSPGVDPCTELETRAGVWRFRADQAGQQFSPAARYATGIRNAMGLVLNQADGSLYTTSHGRDGLAQQWGFTEQDGAELPSEELLRVEQGTDAGWPYCYYDQVQKKLVLAPEYGGDGKQIGRCAGKALPLVAFPGHWAPMSVVFYGGRQFPARYRGGAFVAFHGSWNRAPLPQQGFRVAFAPAAGGKLTGAYETFADGFTGRPEIVGNSNQAAHRPAGLALSPDGGLYVTDDSHGRIWKIVYTGR